MTLKLVWLTLALALLPAVAQAAPGDLDGSFGGDGLVALDWGGVEDFANGVSIQPDGRIVVPGSGEAAQDFIVARVVPDGSPDPSFLGNGFADIPLSGFDEADDVALQADGKIVAAGYGGPGFDGVVTRLNPDGLPDSSFDGDGRATFDFGGTNYVDAIARQSDGKLVVLGWTTAWGRDVARTPERRRQPRHELRRRRPQAAAAGDRRPRIRRAGAARREARAAAPPRAPRSVGL